MFTTYIEPYGCVVTSHGFLNGGYDSNRIAERYVIVRLHINTASLSSIYVSIQRESEPYYGLIVLRLKRKSVNVTEITSSNDILTLNSTTSQPAHGFRDKIDDRTTPFREAYSSRRDCRAF